MKLDHVDSNAEAAEDTERSEANGSRARLASSGRYEFKSKMPT